MALVRRLASVALLTAGVSLVFLGLTRSLGLTAGSVLASAAAIAALLYTGGVWFGAAAPKLSAPSSPVHSTGPLLFDRRGHVIGGPAAGQTVASQFPDTFRADIEQRCAAVLSGRPSRFPCSRDGRALLFDVLPVLGADGTVSYGLVVPVAADLAIAAAVV